MACLSIGGIRTLSSGARVTERIDKHPSGQQSGSVLERLLAVLPMSGPPGT